jgi:hypothetical protein
LAGVRLCMVVARGLYFARLQVAVERLSYPHDPQ